MRLLLFNLATDADDPVLGFATGWVAALAARLDSVEVVTMRAGRIGVPANVRVTSVGKERGYTEARRALVFYRTLGRILRDGPVDACFSHMIPIFSVLAAPVLRPRRIPLVTWYAHPSRTPTLALAQLFSSAMVTSVPEAYPYRTKKVRPIGQGIDTTRFSPGGPTPRGPAILLCAGRLSPPKDHDTLLRAAARLRERTPAPFQVVILGGPGLDRDAAYVDRLRGRVQELALGDRVRFEPPAPPDRLPEWYRRCTAHVNLTPAGFGDKVALEAMACGRPSLVANEGFRETLGDAADRLLFYPGDDEGLATRLQALLNAPEADRDRLGAELRQRVIERHDLDRLAVRLLELFAELKGRRPTGGSRPGRAGGGGR